MSDGVAPPSRVDETTALLLAQVGMQAAYRFPQQLRELRLLPSHAGIIRALGTSPGVSQRALGRRLSILPNRIHMLVTELEERGLVECRGMPGDLRAYAVRLTARGDQALASIRRSARELEDEIFSGLSDEQRSQLAALLLLITARLKLTPGLDAGYRRLGRHGKRANEALRRRGVG